ncbi:MAG: YARHG domain-containing protein, partial [Roseburia sp.]
GSSLSDTNEKTKIFEFVNKTMNADYENSTFEYQALLSVGENDILERSDDNEGDDALEAVSGTSGGYILPESNSRYLSKSELEGLSAEECRLARNEIYARYGRKFDDEVLQSYFNSCDWYIPTIEAGDFQESMLNDYEVANRDLIVEYEQEQSYR